MTALLEDVIERLGGTHSWLYAVLCLVVPGVLAVAMALIAAGVQKLTRTHREGEGDV